MDRVRSELMAMRAEEDVSRTSLRRLLESAITRATLTFAFGSVLALVLVLCVHRLSEHNRDQLQRHATWSRAPATTQTVWTAATDFGSNDVTDRSQTEEARERLYQELRESDKRKDEFLATLAHELRNPLAAIANAILLSTRSGRREHIDWSMELINRQIKHLSRLIDDLLDVSRISSGKIELRRSVLDATPVLESAVETVGPLIDERKHQLTLSFERGNLWMNADPTRLEQVVINLLMNAAKYSQNGGHIWLTAVNEKEDVVITVKDTGAGILPDKVPEMFELFTQGDRTLARSEGGLGIGLAIVKKLVELHGGSITARSDGIGRGSEFSVRLPAARRPSPDKSMATLSAGPAPSPTRVLIIDDNVDVAKGLARLLGLVGHDVMTVYDGPTAIEAARAHNPKIVLLDIGLPGMDGYEVASMLRHDGCCREATFIAISGYGQDEESYFGQKDAGFEHHLVKPIDHDMLLALISDAALCDRISITSKSHFDSASAP